MPSAAPIAIDRRAWGAIVALLSIAAVAPFYAWCWSLDPPDMQEFLIPWYQEIVRDGRIAVFAEPFSNYSPPYLYFLSVVSLADGLADPTTLIRSLSLALTALLAVAMARLVTRAGLSMERALAVGLCLFLLPSVIANAAMLGQSDMLWAAPCLLAVAAAIARRPVTMLFWCGVAFAIKAQAAFLAPFAIGALIAMRPCRWHWLVPFGGYALAVLPALLAGWPAGHLVTIYLGQTSHFAGLISMGAANPWLLATYVAGPDAAHLIPLAWVLGGIAFAATGWIAWKTMRESTDPAQLMTAALLPALALPWLLPMMHARYFFLAEILAVALWVARPTLRHATLVLATQIGAIGGLLAYVTGEAFYAVNGGGVGSFTLGAGRNGAFGTFAVAATAIALVMTLWILRSGSGQSAVHPKFNRV